MKKQDGKIPASLEEIILRESRLWRDERTESPKKRKQTPKKVSVFFGDPYGNRTHVTAVKGPCLNRLTNGPCAFSVRDKVVAEVGFEPTTCRV